MCDLHAIAWVKPVPKGILPKIISFTQNAFVSDRLISGNILIAYKMAHHLLNKRKGGGGGGGLAWVAREPVRRGVWSVGSGRAVW
jgi:hypothetical protein